MGTQSATPGGSHNVIVQAMGDGIHVNVGVARLKLVSGLPRRKEIRFETDILKPEYRAVDLVGREMDEAFLLGWLEGGGMVGSR